MNWGKCVIRLRCEFVDNRVARYSAHTRLFMGPGPEVITPQALFRREVSEADKSARMAVIRPTITLSYGAPNRRCRRRGRYPASTR